MTHPAHTPLPWEILEFNECRHCFGVLELRAQIGWLHTQGPRWETTCERIDPAKWTCLTCGNHCYTRPDGRLYLHPGPVMGGLCGGSGRIGRPPSGEAAAFTPSG